MKFENVYHWSPTKNREEILKNGLKIMMGELEYDNPVTCKTETWKPPYICTSLDPYTALIYVTPTFEDQVLPEMDLFIIKLSDTDQIRVRNDMTREIIEIRIMNSVESSRIKYLATRAED